MAPKASKGSKRAASRAPAEEPSAKRLAEALRKQGIAKAACQPVIDAIQHPFAGLPESTRDMLLACLPWSLVVAEDERLQVQHDAVGMVQEVVEAVRAELEKVVDTETSKVDVLLAAKVEKDEIVQQTEVAEVEASQALQAGTAEVAEADAAVTQKSSALKEGELERSRLGAELETVRTLAAEIEKAHTVLVEKFQTGAYEDSEAESLAQVVLAAAKKMDLDGSMVTALPACLAKRERASFDTMVMCQAEKELGLKQASLFDTTKAAELSLSAKAEGVQALQAELDTAKAHQTKAADGLRSAQQSSAEAAGAARAAKCAVVEQEPELAAATARRGEKQADLEQFCAHNVHAFESLRDRRIASQQAEEPAEEAAADVSGKAAAEAQHADAAAPLAGA